MLRFYFMCDGKSLEVFSRGGTRSDEHFQVTLSGVWRMYWRGKAVAEAQGPDNDVWMREAAMKPESSKHT